MFKTTKACCKVTQGYGAICIVVEIFYSDRHENSDKIHRNSTDDFSHYLHFWSSGLVNNI